MKIGILGCGSIGKRHLANAIDLGHEVRSYDVANASPEYRREVIDWAEAVVIATPTHQHDIDIMDIGDKPFLCEKPLIVADRTLFNTMKELLVGRQGWMGFNLRFHPTIRDFRQYYRARWAQFTIAQYSDKPAYLRDGVISNWASHEIDLALHLLGPAKVAMASSDDNETIADIVIVHESGCRTGIHADYVTDPQIRRFTITSHVVPMECTLQYVNFDPLYVEEMKDWINQIEGNPGRCATLQDGIAVQEIIISAREKAGLA